MTGHTGFKGSWLSLLLTRLGAEVVGYSDVEPSDPSLYAAARVADLVRSVLGDVDDFERLAATVARYEPDVVFHLAAQAFVRKSYDDPLGTFRTNVMGTAHVLEAVRRTPSVRVVVVVTSDKCYRNREWEWGYREVDELGGADPYSASKASAELVADAYRRSYFRGGQGNQAAPFLATARAGNVIGGGDWSPDRIVPDAVRAAQAGQPVKVRSPTAVRPWQHVLDCLDGYLLLARGLWDDPGLAGPWNFGPDEASIKSVAWLVDRVTNLLGAGELGWRHEPPADGRRESRVLHLDSSRARAVLGWRPRLAIGEAMQLTADWYRAVQRDEDARKVTFEQLDLYEALAAESLR